jgi:hypothetical protein
MPGFASADVSELKDRPEYSRRYQDTFVVEPHRTILVACQSVSGRKLQLR